MFEAKIDLLSPVIQREANTQIDEWCSANDLVDADSV